MLLKTLQLRVCAISGNVDEATFASPAITRLCYILIFIFSNSFEVIEVFLSRKINVNENT